jgi:hypothetical protein
MHRPHAKKQACNEAIPQAQDAWCAHVAEVVNSTLMPGTNSWYMGANIAGKARRFLPYLGPEGVGGYRAGIALRSPRRATRASGSRQGSRRDCAPNCGRISSTSFDRELRPMSRLPAWQSPKSSIPVARRGLCGKLTGSRAREQMIGSMTAWGQNAKNSDRAYVFRFAPQTRTLLDTFGTSQKGQQSTS